MYKNIFIVKLVSIIFFINIIIEYENGTNEQIAY
jgi:hypothetical protein